jgi:hypothetical protein
MRHSVFNKWLFIGGIFFMVLASAMFSFIGLNVVEFKTIFTFASYITIPLAFILWGITLGFIDKTITKSKKIKKLKNELELRDKEISEESIKMVTNGSYHSKKLTASYIVLKRNRDRNIEEVRKSIQSTKDIIISNEKELAGLLKILDLYSEDKKSDTKEDKLEDTREEKPSEVVESQPEIQ